MAESEKRIHDVSDRRRAIVSKLSAQSKCCERVNDFNDLQGHNIVIVIIANTNITFSMRLIEHQINVTVN